MYKKILVAIYILLLAVMACATVIEKYNGTEYVSDNIYGSWWFILLWATGVAAGIFFFVRSKAYRRLFVTCLHLSFVIILLGALLTHTTSVKGTVSMEKGKATTTYQDGEGQSHDLDFSITLNRFWIDYHPGTMAPEDYVSDFTIDGTEHGQVSMNNIFQKGTMRLYQNNYTPDLRHSLLTINSDPFGIPVTYAGYALLFFSLVWMLFSRRGTYRQIVKRIREHDTAVKASAKILLLPFFLLPANASAQTVLPDDCADEFDRMFIVYNDRVCPMETFALDFTRKITGDTSYKDFSATQVLTGFIFWGMEWMNEPVLKIKRGPLKDRLNLDDHISPASLFTMNGYVLGPYLQEEGSDKFHKEVYDLDDVMMLIMQVQQMNVMKVFPYTLANGTIRWYSPADKLPRTMQKEQQQYIHGVLPLTAELAHQGNTAAVKEIFQKMLKYQHRYGAASLPSDTQVWSETVYNHVPFATILFMLNLTLAIVSLFFLHRRKVYSLFTALMALSFAALTFCLTLRWIVSGTVPMNNGYETTLVLAWLVMAVSLVVQRYFRLMTSFGLLMSGFMLLVSHIGQMDPAITHRMPVLNSPLLSIHVSIIMMAYALLSLTFVAAVAFFLSPRKIADDMYDLSRLFLYPAMTLLGIGIFVGAIWANVSWGTYWSWDPKETWALITFMVYAAPLHASIRCLQRQRYYHLYMVLAFLTVLMTYFGVNYFLAGMHSYANL